MSCIPRSGGCERLEVEPFVRFLNEDEERDYQHVRCLDVGAPKTPQTAQPEALYEDRESRKRLVIERKTIVWPPQYAQKHRVFHHVMDHVCDALGDFCRTRPITLVLPRLGLLSKREIAQLSHGMAAKIRSLEAVIDEGGVCRFDTPAGRCSVALGIEMDLYGTQADYGIQFEMSARQQEERPSAHSLPKAMRDKLREYYLACENKFADYSDDRRVLLLTPCGEDWLFNAEWWRAVLRMNSPQDLVDEVWLTFEEVTDWGERFWNFYLLHSRSGGALDREGVEPSIILGEPTRATASGDLVASMAPSEAQE